MKLLTLMASALCSGLLSSFAATVTSNADSGPGTLRDAIATAVPGEVIDFAITGTITLTSGELLIFQDVMIAGPGPALLTVERSAIPATPDFRIFNINAGDVAISGLTVRNGREVTGAGINNDETLSLTNVVLTANTAIETGGIGGLGGGLNNNGTVTIVTSVISSNRAEGNLGSGAGGGLYNVGAMFITEATVTDNLAIGPAGANGGGIRNEAFLTASLLRLERNLVMSTGDGQSAEGGGLFNSGTVVFEDSAVNLNQAVGDSGGAGGDANGGGIFNVDGTLTLQRTTVSRNTAQGGSGTQLGGTAAGGGLANLAGTLVLTNTTVSLNAALIGSGPTELPARGAGLFTDTGTVRLSHTTVVSNRVATPSAMDGGGLFSTLGTIEIRNTILAANLATVDLATDELTAFDSAGFNLIGTTNGPVTPGPSDQFNVTGSQLLLGPLQNNGGPTETHALNCGSLAVDAGNNTAAPPTDQRGFARIVNGVIDIGAYEAAAFGTPAVVLSVTCGTAAPGNVVTFSGSVSNSGSVTLSNVLVTSDRPIPNTVVTNVAVLAIGAVLNFSGNFVVPAAETNCFVTNTVAIAATDLCSQQVANDSEVLVCPVTHQLALVCAANVTVQCFDQIPSPDPGTVSVVSSAGGAAVEFAGDTFRTNGCLVEVVRLYVAADGCGNEASCTQLISVRDTIAPVLSGVPTNQTFQCIGELPPSAVVTAVDNCDGPVAVTVASSIAGSCPSLVTITWTATDRCGNTNTASQVITVRDTVPPVLVGVPTNQAYQCLAQVPPPAVVAAIDNCDGPITTQVTAMTNGTCPTLVIYCWLATDRCTNQAFACQTNVVLDTISPVLSTPPSNLTVACLADVPPQAVLTATDNCDGVVQVLPASSIAGSCPTIITRSWRAVDACGNPTNVFQTITVDDNTPPILNGIPPNQTYANLADVPPPANVTATDGCEGAVPVTVMSVTNGFCPGAGLAVIYCWSAMDTCTNLVTACQTNFVNCSSDPCLQLTKTASSAAVLPGSPVTYHYAVTNCGDVALTNIVVRDDNGTLNQPTDDFVVATNLSLPAGQGTNLSVTILFPVNLCGPSPLAAKGNTAPAAPIPCVACLTNVAVASALFNNETVVALDDAIVCALTNQVPCPEDFSYWKKNLAKWPLAYSPDQTLGSVFAKAGSAANKSLLFALEGKAGKGVPEKELFREAVAALLNAATPSISFSLTVNEVINGVNMALMNGGNLALNNLAALLRTANGQRDCEPGSQGCLVLTKEVACLLPGDDCGPFDAWALGYKTVSSTPSFCFSLTVSNCGLVPLTNLTIIDSHLGDLSATFVPSAATPLMPGSSITRFYKLAVGADTTNTATASGKASQTVSANARAVVFVAQAAIVCEALAFSPNDVDGNPSNGQVQLPNNGAPHPVTLQLIVRNPGDVALTNVVVTATNLFGCSLPVPFALAPGQAVTNTLCTVNMACPVSVFAQFSVTAEMDNSNGGCVFDSRGSNEVLRSDCDASIGCQATMGTARMTGGGRQDSSFPPVNHVSHGGQIGSPVGDLTEFDPDSECIRGNWRHTRHGNGGGSFRADSFDSLMAACLGCPDNPAAAGTAGGLCNADDRTCGPEPRRAPANKICFSGVGEYSAGGSANRTALFRVDVEDRGEPGNSHAGGGTAPHDRHRIRVWILTPAEVVQLNNPNDRLLAFRRAIACSVNSSLLTDGAVGPNGLAVPLGTPVFAVRPPNVDDGGVMDHGNHQLHPGHKRCEVEGEDGGGSTTNPAPPIVEAICPGGSDFWSRNLSAWHGYASSQSTATVFGSASKQAHKRNLLEALGGKAGTGGERDLLQQATAALLNATRPGVDFPFTASEIITAVNSALQNQQSLVALTTLLRDANEAENCD